MSELDIEPCHHCGRLILAGPPCCEASAKDAEDERLRLLGLHPDQVAEWRRAKRERRITRRGAR